MIRRLTEAAAQQMTHEDIQPPRDAHVVIAAKNAASGIAQTLTYLARVGFKPDQIHVVVNGATDDTDVLARQTGLATVYKLEEILANRQALLDTLRGYRIPRERLRGKGVAMFAGVLALNALDLSDDAPVIFLDADITNIKEVDPVRYLLAGWHTWKDDPPDIIKLASQGRENTGILAFLNATGWKTAAAFEWPLCGQMIVPWKILQEMRLATGYCVETAMILDCVGRHGDPSRFGEVCIGRPLVDGRNPESKDVVMFVQIMDLVLALRGRRLHELDLFQLRELNNSPSCHARIPSELPGNHPTTMREVALDAILPSLREIVDGIDGFHLADWP